ncbi:G protein-regulated inducer of neurite outgrowth 2 [Microtus oregoni]|uniref:G protein-regulated inducer of neurite outgrowth 2 n=1 Tax=Microtus oregoni TaxID=111838 RepID=UPI001BB11A6A|nr:G protein-regulated inducer of neurite outgrowth 2 [Microtus oregoni]XP_041518884.1 G protein-regulated inducer of neurite outgrowth 2 [Microtus oregoni]
MSSSQPEPGARESQSPRPQPLSQSSSSLLCEGREQRPELRKSVSSTVWHTQPGEASTGARTLEEEGCQTESMEQAQAPSPWSQGGAGSHWRSRTVGNVSTMGISDLCRLRAPSVAAVQRSHSDLVHSAQTRGRGGAQKASLSCSALGSSPVQRAHLQPGSVAGPDGQTPAVLQSDLAPEDGTSKPAHMLGESQVLVPTVELEGTAGLISSPQGGPKATGQSSTTSCQALPPAALLCTMRETASGGCCHVLAFPKLVASVSESGLQAQCGMKFHCKLPGGVSGHPHCCVHPWVPTGLATESVSRTKDVWTMTSATDLALGVASAQDAGVQVAPVAACKAVATSPSLEAPETLNMFPEVVLASSLEEASSPVRDVRWDAEGMTWEVYGASVDPEVLGIAIQKHLEMQFEQLQQAPASEDSLSTEGRRGPLRAVMQSLRRPSCCGCSGAALE